MRISDWSSDVCSADLDGVAEFLQRLRVDRGGEPPGVPGRLGRLHCNAVAGPGRRGGAGRNAQKNGRERRGGARKSVEEGMRVSVSVALGGRRLITKKI